MKQGSVAQYELRLQQEQQKQIISQLMQTRQRRREVLQSAL